VKIINIIFQVSVLVLFNFIGNLIHDFFNFIIPGSIIGLLLLFLCLNLKIIPVKLIENGAVFLLSILMLFFIPATVGIMNYSSLLSLQGILLIAAVLISTSLSIIIAGRAGQRLEKRVQRKKENKRCNKHYSHSA